MKFILDTDTCVFWLRGRVSVRERLVVVGPEQVAISIMTVAELRYGADCSVRPEANHQAIDHFVRGLLILGISPEIARMFGSLKADLRKAGQLIEDLDLMIAATARVHDLTLVTNNTSHFQRVRGLDLENWSRQD